MRSGRFWCYELRDCKGFWHMNMNKNRFDKNRFDVGDLLLLLGVLLMLSGTYLYDWRLSVITAGLLLMSIGLARLATIRGSRL